MGGRQVTDVGVTGLTQAGDGVRRSRAECWCLSRGAQGKPPPGDTGTELGPAGQLKSDLVDL